MATLDISELLKAKFINITLKHSANATIREGQIDTYSPCPPLASCQFLRELGYADLTFDQMQLEYGELQRSNLPKQIVPRRWILENFTDLPDKKNLTLTLTYTETVVAGMSNVITEGRNSTFNASATFDFKVYGKYSFGYSETITLSVQNTTSKSETRTTVKTENYDFGYEIPPHTAAIVDLTKELATFRTPIKAKFIVDGYFFIISHGITSPGFVQRGTIDKGWGRISDYLSEKDRTIEFEGMLDEVVGETTRRSTRFEPLKTDTQNALRLAEIFAPHSHTSDSILLNNNLTARISVLDINAFQDGYFEVNFNVDTGGCLNSSCAGFDATLVFDKDGELFQELYSFEGWAVSDTGISNFLIRRTGSRVGILVDVINIDSPSIVCDDDSFK